MLFGGALPLGLNFGQLLLLRFDLLLDALDLLFELFGVTSGLVARLAGFLPLFLVAEVFFIAGLFVGATHLLQLKSGFYRDYAVFRILHDRG
jgi:hypothetical protein